MKRLLFISFTFISLSATAQYATYTPLETPEIVLPQRQQNYYSTPQTQKQTSTTNQTVKKEEPKEQVYRATGYYIDLRGETARVSLKFTVKQTYTGEALTIVGYNNGVSWIDTYANAYKTGYGDPKEFGYKVGVSGITGTIYFNY